MSRLLRKKQDKKLIHHTFLYKKTSVPINNSCGLASIRGQKKIRANSRTR